MSEISNVTSKVQRNWGFLDQLIDSMNCAVQKAKCGSDAEDCYFLEKLRKAASAMGYDLVKQK